MALTKEQIDQYKDLQQKIIERCEWVRDILAKYVYDFKYVKEFTIVGDEVKCKGTEDLGWDCYQPHIFYIPMSLLFTDDETVIREYGYKLRKTYYNK